MPSVAVPDTCGDLVTPGGSGCKVELDMPEVAPGFVFPDVHEPLPLD